MFKRFSLSRLREVKTKPWVCSRCLQTLRRSDAGGAAVNAATASAPAEKSAGSRRYDRHPPFRSSSDASHDDRTLRKVFDSDPFWKEFSQQPQGRSSTGLLQNLFLTKPSGFQEFAEASLSSCKSITKKITAATVVADFKKFARQLDLLSDNLCRVVDIAEFIRVMHPDPTMKAAADAAHSMMLEYMNTLNTSPDLHHKVDIAMGIPEVVNSWTTEEFVATKILLADFGRAPTNKSSEERQRFVKLSSDVSDLGNQFLSHSAPAKPSLSFSANKLRGIDAAELNACSRWGSVTIPTAGSMVSKALRSVDDSDVRRQVYTASQTCSKAGIEKLEELLQSRTELAHLSGYDSYSDMVLSEKMAKTPDAVLCFLEGQFENNKKIISQELQELVDLKRADGRKDSFPDKLNVWDRDYYTSKALAGLTPGSVSDQSATSEYLSLGTVMQGLSRILTELYGLRLVPICPAHGETWHSDVRRLDVIDEQAGRVAVIYCDFSSPGESRQPTAHFTLRCSRRIGEDELEAAALSTNRSADPEDIVTDGMASARKYQDGELYQLPTICLVCNFSTREKLSKGYFWSRKSGSKPSQPPTLLSFGEVEVLFHEMGHAVHSMLGRTELQNVAGTRCATDFAEIPSTLMEHFATAPDALPYFARHYETDQVLPPERIAPHIARSQRMQATWAERQIVLSVLDQRLHCIRPGPFSSTDIHRGVLAEYASLPEPRGTSSHGYFDHLVGYGAMYYSYLFDKAIAAKIWKDVFRADPARSAINREAGERFKEECLKWGGSRDGWKCLAGVLRDESLVDGGKEAMTKVGQWGVEKPTHM